MELTVYFLTCDMEASVTRGIALIINGGLIEASLQLLYIIENFITTSLTVINYGC